MMDRFTPPFLLKFDWWSHPLLFTQTLLLGTQEYFHSVYFLFAFLFCYLPIYNTHLFHMFSLIIFCVPNLIFSCLSRQSGEEWTIDECSNCRCVEGRVKCQVKQCRQVECGKDETPVTIPGQCCPICQKRQWNNLRK